MQSALTVVTFVVVGLALLIGLIATVGGSAYDQIGGSRGEAKGGPAPGPAHGSPAGATERETEIRQMLQARSERLVRHGREPLDIEAELARLTATDPSTGDPADVDPRLLIETRQVLRARNQLRVRAGQEPLDVEAEVMRTLRELDR